LVLMFEWLTLWPTCAPLPVKSHRRDIGKPLNFPEQACRTKDPRNVGRVARPPTAYLGPRTYSQRRKCRQAARLVRIRGPKSHNRLNWPATGARCARCRPP
jgi:hypothetical protein